MDQSVVLPPGILSTCANRSRRRPLSYGGESQHSSHDEQGSEREGRRTVSMLFEKKEHPEVSRPTLSRIVSANNIHDTDDAIAESSTAQPRFQPASFADHPLPQPVAIDFGQSSENHPDPKAEAERRDTIITIDPIPDGTAPAETVLEEANTEIPHTSSRFSRVLNRLSYVARRQSVVSYQERPSGSSDRYSWRFSALFRGSVNLRGTVDLEKLPRTRKRNSKIIPKSWRFLGIDASGLGNAVSGVTDKLHTSSAREMYNKAKIKQEKLKRSKMAQSIFKYTFYTLLIACVYFVFIGLPLWRGAVWYMYILFEKHLVLKAGLTITFGLGFLPLLINFEPTAPTPDLGESGPPSTDTALIIPCYKSEKLIGDTLEAALKIFPRENIFVIANGNSAEPLDNTAAICKEYDVSHTWSPLGSKIIAQFVGCHVARNFKNVLLIDDDCLLPPNLPIVSDRLRGRVKCIGYIMASVGAEESRGTLCQQAQDLEYKLSGLAKSFAGKVGSVTFPHGCIVLWDRELLVRTFLVHPGFSVSEDWFFGHAARQLGSRIKMCTSTFVKTETPSSVFFSSGGARGGFGEYVTNGLFKRYGLTGLQDDHLEAAVLSCMYYDLAYILFDWKLGWWEIGAKIFVFQEIYETLLYLFAPFVIPISFATRPVFSSYLYVATICLYIVNAVIFNYVHLRTRNQSVTFKALLYYIPFKWVLGFVNIASCYYAIYTYATYFAKRHPKIIEDDKAVEIVLKLEQREMYEGEKEEIEDLNELMGKIMRPVAGRGEEKREKRRTVIEARTSVVRGTAGYMDGVAGQDFGALEKNDG
ncbi:MAG: hypothetical protein Q9218_005986 [Villophora microphyllina]